MLYKPQHKYDITVKNDRVQLECLLRAIKRKRFGCFFQQRVGKSRVGVDYLGNALTQDVDRVLILCPPSASMGWVTELQMLGDTGRTVHFQYWTAGAQAIKIERPLVLLASYDLATTNAKKLRAFSPTCIVFDEVHMLKNISSRHKTGRMLADKAEWVLGLTGTPFSNREYLDVYGIFRVIDPSLFGTNKKSFIDKYASYKDEYGTPLSWLSSAEKDILETVAGASMRVTREDVGILLDTNERVIKYELNPDERMWYNAMRDTSVVTDHGITCAARHTWAWKIRLSQICCGFLEDTEGDSGAIFMSPARPHALSSALNATHMQRQQVIVVIRFVKDLQLVQQACMFGAKRNTFVITGGLTATERKALIAKAKATPESVLIVQERTVAMGMDLSYTNQMLFYSWSDDSILHSQLKDRITGRFQDSTTANYYYIVAEHTSDRQLLRNTINHLSKADSLANWEKYRLRGRAEDESMETS